MKITLLKRYILLACSFFSVVFFNLNVSAQTASSLDFDGVDDNVQIPHFARPSNMTVEGWIKTSSISNALIVGWGGATGNSAEFKLTGGVLSYYEWDGLTFPGVSSSITVNNNSWHHVAVVRTSSATNNTTIYVDGVVAGIGTVNQSITTTTLNIGGLNYFGIQQLFNGNIDDIRIWNRALCQTEILNNLNCEIATTGTGLLANFHFNQGTSGAANGGVTTLIDASGNGNNGTLSNFALTGSSSNWVNPHSLTSGVFCAAFDPEINVLGNALTIVDGDVTPSTADHTDFGNLGAGGSVVRTFTIQNTGTSNLSVSSIAMSGADAALFTISALSPASPIAASSSATFSVTFAPTSIGTKTATVTISSNDCNETTYDFVLSGSSIAGESLYFDGSNDYVLLPDATINNLSSGTIESWIYLNSNTEEMICVKQHDLSNTMAAFSIGNFSNIGGNNSPGVAGKVYFHSSNGVTEASSVANLSTGQWYHVAVTFNSTQAKIYINGVLDNTISGNYTVPSDLTSNGTTIGGWLGGGGGRYFDGKMDEFRVWNRVLCQNEIQNNMNCEIATTGLGLLANYHFNHGIASSDNSGISTLNDVSGSSFNGALTNFGLSGATSNWFAPGAVVSGVSCAAFAVSEINLVGNGTSIINGDLTPSLTDHTDFSTVCVNQSVVRTYTIQNTGASNLAVSGTSMTGPDAALFTIGTLSPASPILPSSSAVFSVTFSPVSAGAKNATINITSNDCDESNYAFAITGSVNALPAVTASATNSVICLNASTTLNGGGATTYTWTGGVTNGAAFSPTATASYTVTGTAAATGCTNTAVQSVTVNSLPVVTASATNSIICLNASTTLNGGGATTYTWTGGVTNGAAFSPTATASYTVTGTAAATGCTNTAVKSVTVNSLPVVTASATNSVICLNASTTLNGGGATTYTWTGGVTNGAAFSPTATASYTVTGTAAATGCTNTAVKSVTVNSLPVVTASATNSVICLNASTTLNGGGATTYTWTGGVTNGSAFSPTATASYTVTGTAAATSCTNTAVQSVTVNSLPVVTASTTNSVICFGKTTTLSGGGANTYTWTNGVTNAIAFSPTATATYTVTGTLAATGCTNTATKSITVNPLPSLTVTIPNVNVCLGKSTTITASGANTYTWTGGISNGASFSPTISTTYTVTATLAATGCTDTAIQSITVNALPSVTASTTNSVICLGYTTSLIGSGANTYTWTGGVTDSSPFSPTSTLTYTVFGTSAATGCSNTAVKSITVNSLPNVVANTTNSVICFGKTTTLFGSGANTYIWTNGVTNGVSFSPTITTTYTVTGTLASTGCSNTAVKTITVNPLPPITINVSSPVVCLNFSTSLSGVGALTYTWTGGISDNVPFTPTTTTTYTVRGTAAITGCTNTAVQTITVNPLPVVTTSANPPVICFNDNTILTGIGADVYSWNNGVTDGVAFSPTTTTTYTVIGTIAATGCTNSAITTITVNPLPIITAVAINSLVCYGKTTTLVASGATTYTWSNGVPNNASFVPTVTAVYTVTGTAAATGCTNTASQSVTILALPTITVSNNSPICNGEALNFLAVSNGTAFGWFGPQGFTSAIQNPTIAIAAPNNSGIYTCKATAANSCTNFATTSVTVNPTPILSTTGSTLCQGQTLNLLAFSFAAATYTWDGPNSFSSSVQNPSIALANPNMSGVYNLTVASVFGCTNTSAANVTVMALPNTTISSNSPICFGDTLSFSASGGNSYVWYGPNGFFSSSTSTLIPNANLLANGVYTLISTTGPCVIPITASLTVNALPTPVILNNSPICERNNIVLSANGAATYLWSGPSSYSNTSATVTISSANLSHSGVYSLSTIDVNGCKASTTTAVSILSIPSPTLGGDSVCIGQNATLFALGGISYFWTGPAGFTSSLSSVSIPSVSSGVAGNYSVTITGINGCFIDTVVSLGANTFELPIPIINTNTNVCFNSKLNLNGSGGVSYLWRGPASFSSTSQSVSFTAKANTAGIYTLSVVNNSNCAASTTVMINVYPQPKATLVSQNNGTCVPFCTNFTTNVSGNIAPLINFKYQVNEKFFNDSLLNYCFDKAGNYFISVNYTDTNNCSNTASLSINVYEKPVADFDFYPSNPVAGSEPVLFTSNSSGASQTSWTWYFIKSKTDTVTSQRVDYLFNDAGNYPVAMIVKNRWGCSDTTIKTVSVSEEFNLFVPNSFTPNGDGLNDTFQFFGASLLDTKLEIYNKWGQKIFYTSDLSIGWDGTFNGKKCVSDKYTYKLEYKNLNLKQRVKMGSFYLIQ